MTVTVTADAHTTDPALEFPDDLTEEDAGTAYPAAARARVLVASEHLATVSVRATLVRLVPAWMAYVLAATVGLWADSIWMWIPCWFVMAWVFAGNAALVHEAAHGHLFASGTANRLLGTAAAAPIGVLFSSYRTYHFEHHRRTALPGDPEGTPLRLRSSIAYLAVLFVAGVAVSAESVWFSIRTLLGRPPTWVRTRAQRRAMNQNTMVLALVAAFALLGLIAAPRLTLELWLVPALATMLILGPFLFLPEHYGATGEGPILDNTRSIRSNPVLRYVFWNNNFHAAHHLTPAVPFHNLPRVAALTDPELRSEWAPRSYVAFHWSLLRLPLFPPARHPPPGR